MTLSISHWREKLPCSEAAQLYFLFQEAESLISYLKRMGSDSAAQVREVRFVPSTASTRVRAVKLDYGYIRLEIATSDRVNPAKPVSLSRDEIYRSIPDALASVR